MMRFEYRDWESDFLDMIELELSKPYFTFDSVEDAEDKIHEFLLQDIDNACIYYKDCFAIVVGLWVTCWDDISHWDGEIKNITQLAYASLKDHAYENAVVEKALDRVAWKNELA
jgi:hypothetical protein